MGPKPAAQFSEIPLPRVKIFTLGRFAVEIEGSSFSLAGKGGSKPFSLLKALIAFGGEHVQKSQLVEALWPDSDGDRAHWAFATNLSRLRKLIGKDAFFLEDNRLSFNPEICWVDALELLGALRGLPRGSSPGEDFPVSTEVEKALSLYWGPFLQGEESPYPVLSLRETLHDLYLKQVERLGNHFAETGQFDKAGALYRQALNMDDQAEFLYQGLMRCCQKQGRIAEGVALFHRCQRTLRIQLGIDPSPATGAIHQEILAEQRRKYSLPGQPSLAFLPFKNLTGDPEQEYFGDGLVFDIATDLVKISSLFLINNEASFPYKNAQVTAQQVGRELGVGYVLEGSVRKAEGRVRVTAQLIETESGRAVWGERFDGNGDDLLTVQDRITEEIVTAIDVNLVHGEAGRIVRKSLKNLEARERYYKGLECDDRHTVQGMFLARKHFEEVISLEPDSPIGYAYLAWTYWWEAYWGLSGSTADSLALATKWATHALELESTLGSEYSLLGNIHLLHREHGDAISNCERAVEYRPQCSSTHVYLANVLQYSGKPREAIDHVRQAIRLRPVYPPWFLVVLARAYLLAGFCEEALETAREAAHADPELVDAKLLLAAAHCALGQIDEARRIAPTILHLHPEFTLRSFAHSEPFMDAEPREQMLSWLKKAGLR